MIPYDSPTPTNDNPTASKKLRLHSPLESALAVFIWGTGTFLLLLLVSIDLLFGTKLPGGLIYVSLVLGPILGILGATATQYKKSVKIGLIVTTLCLVPIQFVIIGIVLLAATGFDGIH